MSEQPGLSRWSRLAFFAVLSPTGRCRDVCTFLNDSTWNGFSTAFGYDSDGHRATGSISSIVLNRVFFEDTSSTRRATGSHVRPKIVLDGRSDRRHMNIMNGRRGVRQAV